MNLLDIGKTIRLNYIDLIKDEKKIPCGSFGRIQDWLNDLIVLEFKIKDSSEVIHLKRDAVESLLRGKILTIIEEPLTIEPPKFQENQLVKYRCGTYGLINGKPEYNTVEGSYLYRINDLECLLYGIKDADEELEEDIELVDKCEIKLDYLNSPTEYKVTVEKTK